MEVRLHLPTLIAAACVIASIPLHPVLAQGTYSTPSTPRMQDRGTSAADEKKAQAVVGQLIGQAKADVAGHRYAEATKAAENALKVSEQLYGSRDPRLVDALSTVVYTRLSWDNYAASTGAKAPSGLNNAVKAQERIAKIHGDGSDLDPKTRVGALVDLGDVYLYADDERAIETYRSAWQLQAQLASAEAADALFASVGAVRLALPPNPAGHEEWVETVSYDVGADGRIAVTDVAGPAPESLSSGIRAKYTEARFRPRVVGGEPVATTGLSSSHKYVAN